VSAYQTKVDRDLEPLILTVAEDMRDLVQSMHAVDEKKHRALVGEWIKQHPGKAALVLNDLATFVLDLTRIAEAKRPVKRQMCDKCDGCGTVPGGA
jgi:hypothetical protein